MLCKNELRKTWLLTPVNGLGAIEKNENAW